MTDDVDLSTLLYRPKRNTLDFKAKGYDLSNRQDKQAFAKDLASFVRELYRILAISYERHPGD